MTRSTRWIGYAATLVACAALTACSSTSSTATPTGTSTTTPAATPTTTAPASTTPATTPSPSTTTVTATVTATPKPVAIATSTKDAAKEATLGDGKQYVIITGVNAAQKTVVVDVVQFFGGAAAVKAAAEDGGDAADDYWVRNANPQLRTLPVTAAARITVNSLAWEESDSATKDVPKTLAQLGGYRDLDQYLFTVTVAGGKVTGIAQVFLP